MQVFKAQVIEQFDKILLSKPYNFTVTRMFTYLNDIKFSIEMNQ